MAFGSLAALGDSLTRGDLLVVTSETDVVIVPTAAAFIGATEAAIDLSMVFEVRERTGRSTDAPGSFLE